MLALSTYVELLQHRKQVAQDFLHVLLEQYLSDALEELTFQNVAMSICRPPTQARSPLIT